MRFILNICLMAATLILLTSCSYFITSGQDKHYLSAKSLPPLKIPPGISSDAFENKYPVSQTVYPEQAKSVSLVPPGLY